ncbi:hypothetical protein UFOVP1122_1, partial [uncultured Caudovirales phage]
MSELLGGIHVEIGARLQGLETGLKRAAEQSQSTANKIEGIFSGMSSTLGALGLQVGILGIGGAAIKLA